MIYNSHDDMRGKWEQRCSLSQRCRKENSYSLVNISQSNISSIQEKGMQDAYALRIIDVDWNNNTAEVKVGLKIID